MKLINQILFCLLLIITTSSCYKRNEFTPYKYQYNIEKLELQVAPAYIDFIVNGVDCDQNAIREAIYDIAESVADKVTLLLSEKADENITIVRANTVNLSYKQIRTYSVELDKVVNVRLYKAIPYPLIPYMFPSAWLDYYIQTFYASNPYMYGKPQRVAGIIYDKEACPVCTLETYMQEYMQDNDRYLDADYNFLAIDGLESNDFNTSDKLLLLIYPNRFYSTYWFGSAQYFYFIFRYALYNLNTGEMVALGKSNKSHLFVGITRQTEKPIILKRHITELITLTAKEIAGKISNYLHSKES